MRRSLARFILVLFALRALVPAGYMPDLGAIKSGAVEFVLCTAHDDAPVAPQPISNKDQCPFGMVLANGFVAPVSPALPARAIALDVTVFGDDATGLHPPSHGPPLGSRAPPVLHV